MVCFNAACCGCCGCRFNLCSKSYEEGKVTGLFGALMPSRNSQEYIIQQEGALTIEMAGSIMFEC